MPKRAVLLINLGSPDSTSVPDVRRYLREFLGDERVLDMPAALRWLLLEGIILRIRSKKSAHAYGQVWTAEGSPLLVIARSIRQKLGEALGSQLPVYLAMRYGNPSVGSVVAQMGADGIEDVLLFPQYPHYAMSSWETVVVKVLAEAGRVPGLRIATVQPFFADPTTACRRATCARPTRPGLTASSRRTAASPPPRPTRPATEPNALPPPAPLPPALASRPPGIRFRFSPAWPANHGCSPTPTTSLRGCPPPG